MAQSAPKERALLGFERFWEWPTLEPTDRTVQNNPEVGDNCKRRHSIDILQETPPEKVTFHPEPTYEEDVDTAQSEWDHKICNEQLINA